MSHQTGAKPDNFLLTFLSNGIRQSRLPLMLAVRARHWRLLAERPYQHRICAHARRLACPVRII